MTMRDSSIESFHLAYVPDANIESSVDATIGAISLRIASSFHLYRCHTHASYSHEIVNSVHEDYLSRKNNTATASDMDDRCSCCCCRVEKFIPDSLFPIRSSTRSEASAYTENTDNSQPSYKHGLSIQEADMLAVIVPSLLTRRISELLFSNVNLGMHIDDKQIIDAEADLRRSIHPCLCDVHGKRDEGFDSNEKYNNIKCKNIKSIPPSQIHVCGVITASLVTKDWNVPSDIILLSPSQTDRLNGTEIISYFSNQLNHDTASNIPWFVLKAFPIKSISILSSSLDHNSQSTTMNQNDSVPGVTALPCCTVCLNLIEPTALGLPELKPDQRCSRWCLSPKDTNDDTHEKYSHGHFCVNEEIFFPSPQCAACHAIFQEDHAVVRMSNEANQSCSIESPFLISPASSWSDSNLFHKTQSSQQNSCYKCGLTSNLWVCLTCGVIGCGRYARKHAEEHYTYMGHPYSFESVTGRIWDYDNGKFVHRTDLIECPVVSPKLVRAVASDETSKISSLLATSPLSSMRIGQGGDYSIESYIYDRRGKEYYGGGTEDQRDLITLHQSNLGLNCSTQVSMSKSVASKKSIMVSQEYEALLQSALEDQAQHYQGEISRIRAQSISSRIMESDMTVRESGEIDALRTDIERLKQEIEKLSSALLDDQRNELRNRSLSQRLLREQCISKELLEKLRMETSTVLEKGKQRAIDLEMQIDDLAANIRMMSQFAEDKELNQAQICGTIEGIKDEGKKGAKQRSKLDRRGRKR